MNEFELALFSSLLQILPQILSDHPCGLYELAQESAKQLHQPIQEVLTPFTEAMNALAKAGTVHYDRQHNQVHI